MNTTPNQSRAETAGREKLKPRFGDIIENGWASESNPQRRGFFVRKGYRKGRMNAGQYFEMTDGKGNFWEHSTRGEHRLTILDLPPLNGREPEGWKLVPVEPTMDMLWAASQQGNVDRYEDGRAKYRAMLKASPAPPLNGGGEEALREACQAVVDVSRSGADTVSFLVNLNKVAKQCAAALATLNVQGGGDALDAARWRALMSVPRIRMQGSAGVDPETGKRRNGPAVHFGAEFWTDMGDDYDRSKDPQNALEWGLAALTATADRMIERAALSVSAPPVVGESQ